MINGNYSGKVKDACMGRSKSGSLQVELLLGTEDGQEISCFLSLSGGAMVYSIEKLKYLGLEDGKGPETVIGADVEWAVEPDTYNGKTVQRVNIHTRRPGLATKPADRISAKEAASILFPAAYVPPAQRNAQPQREPGDDSDPMGDLPF